MLFHPMDEIAFIQVSSLYVDNVKILQPLYFEP
jgi:hypothetical protein